MKSLKIFLLALVVSFAYNTVSAQTKPVAAKTTTKTETPATPSTEKAAKKKHIKKAKKAKHHAKKIEKKA